MFNKAKSGPGEIYSWLGRPRSHINSWLPMCITDLIDNVEEAVQSKIGEEVRCMMILSRYIQDRIPSI